MSAPLYDPEHDAKIVDWRCLCFLRLDFEPLDANALAIRRDINRADVEAMRSGGWTPKAILAALL